MQKRNWQKKFLLKYRFDINIFMCVLFCTEEICTLVIAEAFPEDGGLFCCTASNPHGSVNCTANLTVTAGWYIKAD